jgi:UDP-2-acetamido-3-amino-2,3-dideoxy-glucuronate N-acetyltransferase
MRKALDRPIDVVRAIALPCFRDDNGDLVMLQEGSGVPFRIARVFVVRAPQWATRGQHAHKTCAQFLTCPTGSLSVVCDDGSRKSTHILDRPDVGLLVPSGIWAEEVYTEPDTILTVLCDRPYEAHDYIRDYADFLAYRASLG